VLHQLRRQRLQQQRALMEGHPAQRRIALAPPVLEHRAEIQAFTRNLCDRGRR
jgi:hypothetical protein